MPKLPDFTALGQAPSFRTGRPAAEFAGVKAGPDAFGADVGAGVQKLGAIGVGIAEEQRKEDDAIDLSKADALAQKRLIETRRAFESDPDHATFAPRFDKMANGILADSASMIRNPSLRDRWVESKGVLEAARTRDQVIRHGDALARQDMFDATEGTLKARRDAYLMAKSDAERAQIMRSADDDIEMGVQSGFLRRQDARKLREKHIDGMKVDDGEARLNRSWQDPNEALGLIRDLTGGSETGKIPSTGRTSESGLDFIRRREGFAPNAKYDKSQYSVGYGTKGNPGETISRAEAERRLVVETKKIDDWVTGNITVPLTQSQHDALASFGLNLGTGALDKIKDDINKGDFAGVAARMRTFNKARMVRGEDGQLREPRPEDGPLTDENSALVEHGGLTGRRADEAELMLGQSPSARYAGLDFRKRHALLTHARNALSTTLQQDAKDAASLLETGKDLPVDAQGRNAFDRARMVLQPNQISRLNIIENEARAKGRALFGTGPSDLPLAELNESQAQERIGAITTGKVQGNVERTWTKVMEQRRKDPAQSVSGVAIAGPGGPQIGLGPDGELVMREGEDATYKFGPAREVRNALKMVAKRIPEVTLTQDQDGTVGIAIAKGAPAVTGQKAYETLFDARRAAQTRVGIADYDQRILTKREAHDLLQIPADPTKMDEKSYVQALKTAADRAEKLFGPKYAAKAFEDAFALQVRGKPHDDAAAGIIASLTRKMIRGEGVRQQDLNRLSTLAELDGINRAMNGGYEMPTTAGEDRNFFSRNLAPGRSIQQDLSRQGATLDPDRMPAKPTPDDINWALKDPSRQQRFDQQFGDGAYAREVQRMRQGKP